MSRPKDQGTRWESELVNRIQKRGLLADRLAEGGSSDKGDVWAVAPPDQTGNKVVLAWKRLTGKGSRRTPDGVRDVVVLDTDTLLDLLVASVMVRGEQSWVIECKATQTLNVTRTLGKAIRKANG